MVAPTASILVVDDEPDLCTLYELTLLREGYRVETASSVQEARVQLQAQRFDAVITDMRLPDGSGMELLQDLREQQRRERCVVMTAYGSAENAVEALRSGAFDYLTKPVDLKQFRSVVASAVQGTGGVPAPRTPRTGGRPAAAAENAGAAALERLVGQSETLRNVKQRVAKVSRGMAPVLIHGESGTGKELVAQALHANSQRADGPLVAVNCGAIPENLLEAEFFGARKGSYTGATQDRDGYFQAARGGTLFLDEIGDLPLAMQSKLLRVIQERSVRPLGSTQEETVDVRIVSATHRNLAADVQSGRFRQDLYYRLNVIEILVPPLRERREDLPALCTALLARIAQDSGMPVPTLTQRALGAIAAHPLTGNVRELENLLHRAVALSDGDELHVDWPANTSAAVAAVAVAVARGAQSPAEPADPAVPRAEPPSSPALSAVVRTMPLPHDLQAWLDQQEREILVRALREAGFNRTATAARLGISLRQIRYRIARLNITLPNDQQEPHDDIG
ncbi:sigma-54-dependent Fis family transcriptional regulator [Verminephrobacter aporrectodeae subsp. tuberculatae]|uniref:sigma-54-dependent transcriptional regulator n=1 Tax=Verminephrobacter aporrectodeae TaxID=1110389 RepID=UPI0022381C2B|nr:sigma-54 dependent transcriptional regulator [Verminephrobacter aporrectodeae]MCW5222397.1 sigma-54-dependent Fis family transcriptional regulator [Verminephrobacter aporrectodeae subsp. tuberculatae]MCW5257395.1 sigma-54-dependent Fis family transcriptional regulator [Verminephrobacter aporrectodeae subsp. tuberculatae]MCW5287861.1 sigma-54-dependent Fis family transcriptional regulator [Verminephrobacter aporrectodeae subsp. tuberculatae]MCW8164608.1 sigma-54-dependent Fis family transcrip